MPRYFKKGNPGGPGRPKGSKEFRDFKKASMEDIIAEWKYLWTLDEDRLDAEIKDRETPALRKWMAKVVQDGIKNNSLHNLEVIFDRIYGKVKTPIDLGEGGMHFQLVQMIAEHNAAKKK